MDYMDTFPFSLSSGRVVGVTDFGDRSSSHVVVLCHAAPGSSRFDPDPVATAGRAVRVIALDRPGNGDSELIDGGPATVARAAADVAEYLDAEGVATVGIAGWSAGGRIALALAAARPDLVGRIALIGTPAPDDEVPWVGDDNRAMLESYRGLSPGEVTAALTAVFEEFSGAEPTGQSRLGDLATPGADDAVLAAARERLVAMLDRSVQQGQRGTAADIVSYTLLDLGFEISKVRAKTLLLYGGADQIGSRHAAWYKSKLSDARIEMVPGAGHLLIVPMWQRVLSHLAPGATRAK